MNFCGIFTGVVYVYGKNQNKEEASHVVMSCVEQVLDTSMPQELHSELASISSADEYSTIGDNANETGNDTNGLSRLDILTIIIASLLFLAIAYYFYIHWSERNYDSTESSKEKSIKLGNEPEEDNNLEDVFVDDDDLGFESYRDDAENDGIFR